MPSKHSIGSMLFVEPRATDIENDTFECHKCLWFLHPIELVQLTEGKISTDLFYRCGASGDDFRDDKKQSQNQKYYGDCWISPNELPHECPDLIDYINNSDNDLLPQCYTFDLFCAPGFSNRLLKADEGEAL